MEDFLQSVETGLAGYLPGAVGSEPTTGTTTPMSATTMLLLAGGAALLLVLILRK